MTDLRLDEIRSRHEDQEEFSPSSRGGDDPVGELLREVKELREERRGLVLLLDRVRPKLPMGTHVYQDVCEALRKFR